MTISRAVRRIIFWEPTPSPHKFAMFEALALEMPEAEIVCMADHPLPAERVALGWTVPEPVHFRLVVAPMPAVIEAAVFDEVASTVHVFSGIRHIPTNVRALRWIRSASLQHRHTFGVLSEPRVTTDVGAWLRWMQSWWEERWMRRQCAFVLAIGRNGPAWYRRVGYAAATIFPFAYFLPVPAVSASGTTTSVSAPTKVTEAATSPQATLRVGYLGRLATEKGIHVLLDAVTSPHWPTDAQLHIAGHGPWATRVRAAQEAWGHRLRFDGALDMDDVPQFLRRLDVLVVPSVSDNDGWGAVVSESLMCGVPVIATPHVGASVALADPCRGRLVAPGQARAIIDAFLDLRREGAFSTSAQIARQQWALRTLTATRGAAYFHSLLAHILDSAPRPADYYLDS